MNLFATYVGNFILDDTFGIIQVDLNAQISNLSYALGTAPSSSTATLALVRQSDNQQMGTFTLASGVLRATIQPDGVLPIYLDPAQVYYWEWVQIGSLVPGGNFNGGLSTTPAEPSTSPRTTVGAVAAIIQVDETLVGADFSGLVPFITAANAVVNDQCAQLYNAVRLELIERWLSAHFYAVFDQIPISERGGDVSAVYARQTGLNLNLTVYGQQAQLLDPQGALARLAKNSETAGQVVGIMSLGDNPRADRGYAGYGWDD